MGNTILAEQHRRYRTEDKRLSYKVTDAALTDWKRSTALAFLSEVSAVLLQQTL